MADAAPAPEPVDVLIVGSGFSGLGMAIALKREGKRSFVVLEKADSLGGTWRDNTYPGCACDIPSHLYSFSFAPNPNWSRLYPPQPEIRAYLESVADRFSVRSAIRFGHALKSARFDEVQARWLVETENGAQFSAKALVSGMGGLHKPLFADIANADAFAGEAFHSAQWRHDLDLTGKRIAVIGSGASAIQFVPEIRKTAARVTVFQRTPPWILPKLDRPMKSSEVALFRAFPPAQNWFRRAQYLRCELSVFGFQSGSIALGEKMARQHLNAQVPDPQLRKTLTPNYRMGCKRVLISNDWYPALQKPNVRLVSHAIERFETGGLRTRDGALHDADIVIYATGFKPMDVLNPATITGRDGRVLNDEWAAHPEAFMGITVAGYPNFFLLMGPNTGLGHNSMVFMIESQIAHVMAALRELDLRGKSQIEVRRDIQNAFNAELDSRMAKTVWKSGCASWYLTADGKASAIWPGPTYEYRARTARIDARDYDFV